jgi:chemotaxis family two-component system response regulator Rcp1
MSMVGGDLNILLVEDNPGDVRLTEEALREGRIANRVWVARDGEEAMDFLHQRGDHAHSPRPDLVLLDLNLPRKDGREVLAEIKSDPELHRTPVIVLTTSNADRDVLLSYDLHANCYIRKPIEYEEFIAAVRGIESFWFKIVRLPRQ